MKDMSGRYVGGVEWVSMRVSEGYYFDSLFHDLPPSHKLHLVQDPITEVVHTSVYMGYREPLFRVLV